MGENSPPLFHRQGKRQQMGGDLWEGASLSTEGLSEGAPASRSPAKRSGAQLSLKARTSVYASFSALVQLGKALFGFNIHGRCSQRTAIPPSAAVPYGLAWSVLPRLSLFSSLFWVNLSRTCRGGCYPAVLGRENYLQEESSCLIRTWAHTDASSCCLQLSSGEATALPSPMGSRSSWSAFWAKEGPQNCSTRERVKKVLSCLLHNPISRLSGGTLLGRGVLLQWLRLEDNVEQRGLLRSC